MEELRKMLKQRCTEILKQTSTEIAPGMLHLVMRGYIQCALDHRIIKITKIPKDKLVKI